MAVCEISLNPLVSKYIKLTVVAVFGVVIANLIFNIYPSWSLVRLSFFHRMYEEDENYYM